MTAVQLEIFSDVVCPWCYIGKTKMAVAVEQFRAEGGQVDIRFRPYLLNPDFHGESRPLTEYLTERFGPRAGQLAAGVTAAGAEVGLQMHMDRAVAANPRRAHQLIEAAYRTDGYQAQQAVATELFAAHFTLGEDIADDAVLAAAGKRAGLSEATITAAFHDPVIAEAVESSLGEALELGISAVPTFVADRSIGVQGAQPPATLLALLRKAAETADTADASSAEEPAPGSAAGLR
jgi:predicted DsbA family dithiol-disulfide isomerase